MKQSDMNHLRRLLGWVRCDIGQSPAELQQTMIDVAVGLGHPDISAEAKTRMVESYRRAESIPLYVRAAVKALEKTLAAGGPDRGAEYARATPESRASIGLHPGADAGHESALNDVQVELGLAEIGIHAWGPRAEDWLAGAEYAARHLRGNLHPLAVERGESDASAAAEPLQNHPNAAANGVACRDTPAEPPTLRRYIQAPPPASAPDDAKAVAWMDPETLDVISAERKASWLAEYGAGGAAKAASYTRALGDLRPAPAAGDARRAGCAHGAFCGALLEGETERQRDRRLKWMSLEALNERQAQPGDMACMTQLRTALILARDSHGVSLLTDPPQDAWKARRVDEVIRAALSAQPGAQTARAPGCREETQAGNENGKTAREGEAC